VCLYAVQSNILYSSSQFLPALHEFILSKLSRCSVTSLDRLRGTIPLPIRHVLMRVAWMYNCQISIISKWPTLYISVKSDPDPVVRMALYRRVRTSGIALMIFPMFFSGVLYPHLSYSIYAYRLGHYTTAISCAVYCVQCII
jgi:hypothetical protein